MIPLEFDQIQACLEGKVIVLSVAPGLIKLERKIWNKKQKEDRLGKLPGLWQGFGKKLWQSCKVTIYNLPLFKIWKADLANFTKINFSEK